MSGERPTDADIEAAGRNLRATADLLRSDAPHLADSIETAGFMLTWFAADRAATEGPDTEVLRSAAMEPHIEDGDRAAMTEAADWIDAAADELDCLRAAWNCVATWSIYGCCYGPSDKGGHERCGPAHPAAPPTAEPGGAEASEGRWEYVVEVHGAEGWAPCNTVTDDRVRAEDAAARLASLLTRRQFRVSCRPRVQPWREASGPIVRPAEAPATADRTDGGAS